MGRHAGCNQVHRRDQPWSIGILHDKHDFSRSLWKIGPLHSRRSILSANGSGREMCWHRSTFTECRTGKNDGFRRRSHGRLVPYQFLLSDAVSAPIAAQSQINLTFNRLIYSPSASTAGMPLCVHNILVLCPQRQSPRRKNSAGMAAAFPLHRCRIGQQTHLLVDRPHDRPDFWQFEREP